MTSSCENSRFVYQRCSPGFGPGWFRQGLLTAQRGKEESSSWLIGRLVHAHPVIGSSDIHFKKTNGAARDSRIYSQMVSALNVPVFGEEFQLKPAKPAGMALRFVTVVVLAVWFGGFTFY